LPASMCATMPMFLVFSNPSVVTMTALTPDSSSLTGPSLLYHR